MNQFKVSVIIVYYEGIKELLACIESIYKRKPKISLEIIVVDNSKEGVEADVKKRFEKVKYIKSPGNIGYGKGNNLGARYAKGEYLFILNPDTKVAIGSLDALVDFLDRNKKAAIASTIILNNEGKIFPLQGARILTPLRGIFTLSFLDKIFPNNFISSNYWMKDIQKDVLREVDMVPGTAFLIRKTVFKEISGFDENFFLFFEESDLCKRIRERGWKIYMFPEAKVVHYWPTKKGSEKLKKIFQNSRFYYFRKHFGLISALMVEAFTRFSKWTLLTALIVFLGIILRFYKINTFINFGGDIGWYYLLARDFTLGGDLPLVSIPTSVPVLKQGAIWTWILALGLKIGNFNPLSGAFLAGLFGIASIILTYLLARSWFGNKVAIIALIISVTSPYLIFNDRMPFQTTPIFFFTLLYAWSLIESVRRKKIHFILLGIWMAVLYQLELAAFLLTFVTLGVFIWERSKIKTGNLLLTMSGAFLGLIPFILHDIKEDVYLQTFGFLAWFFQKIGESILNVGKLSSDPGRGTTYVSEFILPYARSLAVIIFVLSIFFFFLKAVQNFKNLSLQKQIIMVWFFFLIIGLLARGIVSAAYLPLVFFPIIIIVSLFYEFIIKKFGKFGWVFLILICIFNSIFVFQTFYNQEMSNVTYSDRVKVTDFIINDAGGSKFKLIYLGPGYQHGTSDDSWKYLLWWKGNEPVRAANLTYAIIEHPYEPPMKFEVIKDFGYVKVAVQK